MDSEFPSPHWGSQWISFDPHPKNEMGFFAFRVGVDLASKPETFLIRVSADQRYKLYVNGQLVEFGPQRGDELHWFYETIDISQWLVAGQNWIAALVWNFGRYSPMAQHSARLGFVFEALEEKETLNTPGLWKVARLPGLDFDMIHSSSGHFYIDVGPGEILDGRMHSPGWEVGQETQDLDWRNPHRVDGAEDRGAKSGGKPWYLIARSIPSMLYDRRGEEPRVRRGFVGDCPQASLPADGESVPKQIKLVPGTPVLLDYGELLCAYPRLTVAGKPGDQVRLTYSESLWNIQKPDQWWGQAGKPNRNIVDGKQMQGYQDCIVLGEQPVSFEPAWWRTYRYLMLEVVGESEALVDRLEAYETGYPYEEQSTFRADHPDVDPIWDISIRTAKRCAGETYFDCPYYEQLQYVGDTRIQALIHYYMGKDRSLQRNAIETLGWSLMENGLTQSRYPSRQTQVIPPFSLWWVMMLYDQMLYDRMPDRKWLEVVPRLLEAFARLSEDPEHAFWIFGDWVPAWGWGVPPGGVNHPMQQLCLEMAKVSLVRIQDAYAGKPVDRVLEAVSSVPEPPFDSEHAHALYRVLRLMAGLTVPAWPAEQLAVSKASACTYYFSYYKHQAIQPADYLSVLKDWKGMVDNGMTTCAENPEPTRSDCHAWSAHPILGFFQWVAGVTSLAPEWKKARIAPHPGSLKRFDAGIAHPDGDLRVTFDASVLKISTPIPAQVVWNGVTKEIPPGSVELS